MSKAMEPNPYQASATPAAIALERPPSPSDSLLRDWERRRLWFNAILTALTLVLGTLLDFAILKPRFWAITAQGALIANICFCAGPVVTWYLSRLGCNHRATGTFLFWIGTVLSVVLTTAALLSALAPPF